MSYPGIFKKLLDHIGLFTSHGATSEATAGRIALRDGAGRMQAQDPAADLDVVNRRSMNSTSVPLTRFVGTTLPLRGGNWLSTDIALSVDDASTSARGVVRLATAAEASAGSGGGVVTASVLGSVVGDMGGGVIPSSGSGVGEFRAASNSDMDSNALTSTYTLVIPSGGTWAYCVRFTRVQEVSGGESSSTSSQNERGLAGVKKGGTRITISDTNNVSIKNLSGFFWRVS